MQSTQALLRQEGVISGQKVLDIGFRNFQELQEIASLVGETGHVMGIDLGQNNIQAASKILAGLSFPNISLREGSVLAIPAGGRSFDLIFCKGVLHEIRRPEKALAEMARVCKPDGVILIIDIQRFSRIKFELYRARALLKGHHSGDFHPGFGRERLLRMLSQQRLAEVDYRQLPDKWHLGFNEANLFLLKAKPANSQPYGDNIAIPFR